MGGKFSRNKGRRNEYLLRDQMRKEGYLAERVPLSGASRGYKGDIAVEDVANNRKYTLELKVRHNEFKQIFAFVEPNIKDCDVLSLHWGDSINGTTVLCSYKLKTLLTIPTIFSMAMPDRVGKKLLGLKKFVKDCDYLVIKIDHKPFIFIKYLT